MADKYDNWLPKLFIRFNGAKTWAVTIGQTARYSTPEDQVTAKFRAHENDHKRQFRERGILGFFYIYFRDLFKNKLSGMTWSEAYLAIPFEVEAREAANEIT